MANLLNAHPLFGPLIRSPSFQARFRITTPSITIPTTATTTTTTTTTATTPTTTTTVTPTTPRAVVP